MKFITLVSASFLSIIVQQCSGAYYNQELSNYKDFVDRKLNKNEYNKIVSPNTAASGKHSQPEETGKLNEQKDIVYNDKFIRRGSGIPFGGYIPDELLEAYPELIEYLKEQDGASYNDKLVRRDSGIPYVDYFSDKYFETHPEALTKVRS
ncbi:hypothetical protein K502DRAFT_348780 [Neoconidiobolus thromboides FSU 785]|nr:hypothetical protein K502DRAFT_348780 [Neoconidiobolus thromboides FSU 785]